MVFLPMLKKIDAKLHNILLIITALLLLIAVFLTFYQVVTRFVLGAPTPWSELLARGLIIWSVFLGLPCVVRNGELISINIIYKIFSNYKYIIQSFVQILILIVFMVIFKHGIDMTIRVAHQTVPLLNFSMSWLYISIPVGTGLSIISSVLRQVDLLKSHYIEGVNL